MFTDLQRLEQVIDAQEFTSAVITITPDMAELMLARNTGNRNISETQVNLYSCAMAKGLWRLNGESIEFDSSGRLLNGQHRLMAVVKSGVSIRSSVSGGITPDAFSTYDCGRSRTLSQLLSVQGKKNCSNTSSVVRSYYAITNGYYDFNRTSTGINLFSKHRLTNPELMDIYKSDPETYDMYGNFAMKWGNDMKKPPVSSSFAAALCLYLVKDLGYAPYYAQSFFSQVYAKSPSDNPITHSVWTQFNAAGKKEKTDKAYSTQHFIWILIKAWNLYVKGKHVKTLSVQPKELPLRPISFVESISSNNNNSNNNN